MLIGELEALARQHGNHFGNTSSNKPVFHPLLQFYLTPLYMALRKLEGGTSNDEVSFPLEKVVCSNNVDIMKMAIDKKQDGALHIILACQAIVSFMMRDMVGALTFTNLYVEHFVVRL